MNKDQNQDYSVVERALEELEFLNATDEQIRQLQEQQKQRKADMIVELSQKLKQVPLEQANVVASNAYWADPKLADAVRKAYLSGTNRGFVPLSMPTEIACERCGNLITATSWTNYKDIVSRAEHREKEAAYRWGEQLCLSCAEAKRAKRDEESAAYFDCWEEECEAAEREREQREAELQQMSGDEYFQTEHWQLLAQAVVKKAGYRCQLCNTGGILNVHLHTQEVRGRESLADLVVLCQQCSGSYQLIEEIRKS